MKKILVILVIGLCLTSMVSAGGAEEEPSVGGPGPVEFSVFIRSVPDFVPGPQNPWTAWIDEATNSKIEWIAVPYSSAWEKRNTMLASGDYPDVVVMNPPNDPIVDQMIEAERILPLDDFLQYAPNIMEYTHDVSWEAVRYTDDNIYMVPRCTIIREDFWLNRRDWREALGLSVPVTIDDWMTYAQAIATQDPDGNGRNDTFAVTDTSDFITGTSSANIKEFAKVWHAGLDWYDDGTGTLFMGAFHTDGRFKNVLQFYKDLYEIGSLEPDFVNNQGGLAKHEKWRQGVVATNNTFVGAADHDLALVRNIHSEAEVEFLQHPIVDLPEEMINERPVLTQTGVYNAWALTDKAEGIEEHIMGFFDYLLSDEGWDLMRFGVEGVHYDVADGNREFIQPAFGDFLKWQGWTMLFRRPLDREFWLKGEVPAIAPLQEEWFDRSIQTIQTSYIQEGLAGFVSEKEREFKTNDVWTTKFNETALRIIVGQLPLSAWDTFLEDVYNEGWQDVVDDYNRYYQKSM